MTVPLRRRQDAGSYRTGAVGRRRAHVFQQVVGKQSAQAVSEDHGIDPAPASIVMPKRATADAPQEAGEACARHAGDDFRSRPDQTLYTALIEHANLWSRQENGRGHAADRVLYKALLKMTLVLGLLVNASAGAAIVGILMPNLQHAVHGIGTTAFRRVPAMLNYTAGPTASRVPASPAKIPPSVTSRKFLERPRFRHRDALRNVSVVISRTCSPLSTSRQAWAVAH